MGTTYRLELEANDVGQALDGLEQRAEAWERTAEYLRTEALPDGELFVIEECSDPNEADSIAAHYRKIIRTIEAQLEGQR